MKKSHTIFCFLIVSASSLLSQEVDYSKLTGPYLGQKRPGIIPEVFARGIVSSPEKNEFAASFSPAGTEFYFNRGLKIMVCTLDNGLWRAPVPVSFSAGFPAHEAYVPFDDRGVYWGWFKDGGYGIYYNERSGT